MKKLASRKLAIKRGETTYFTGKPCSKGHIAVRWVVNHTCSECTKEKSKAVSQVVRKERNSRYYTKNKDKVLESVKTYRQKFPEKYRKYSKRWAAKNPKYGKARSAKYRATKKQAIPKWADLEKIAKFYNNCPEGYHVDHIVPLQGKLVCGLHVENNLQYLTAESNWKKGRTWE
jgi:hypothetical protein